MIPIKCLSINGHIDPRNNELVYLCLMGSRVPHKHFFDWYNENITYPTTQSIRKQHNPGSIPLGEDEDVPLDQRFVMWGDSDIPYIQNMTSPSRIEKSIKRGIYFTKIGAKITETSQPLDLGPFFKILKAYGKNMSSDGTESPLSILIDILFKQLKRDKILMLPHLKQCSLKELITNTPQMMEAAFSKSSLVESFVSSGMLDEKCKRCPDLYGIIKSFKINWSKVKGGKVWFLNQLNNVISEMMSEGDVVEEFYDDCSFPLDYDHDGNIWKLRSNADHLTSSKVLYHPSVVAKKNEDIRLSVEAKTS